MNKKKLYQSKFIPDFPGYKADTRGNIWSCWKTRPLFKVGKRGYFNTVSYMSTKWRILKGGRVFGYKVVVLSRNKQLYSKRVHRLILETFVGECPKGMEACHNNGIRNDNRLENLRWDTVKNNEADKRLHGTMLEGEKCHFSKLNKFQVQRIKLMREITPRIACWKIGKIFNTSRQNIQHIIKKESWKHI